MGRSEEGGSISDRLRELRERLFGPRGRARFARALGISPSTYNYYEKGRQPPADLLARAAEVTGARLEWLLTGRGDPFAEGTTAPGAEDLPPALQDALRRFTEAVGDGPGAASARVALGALLGEIRGALAEPSGAERPAPTFRLGSRSVPILARTAAGLTAEWEAFFRGQEDPGVLAGLVEGLEGRTGAGRGADLRAADPQPEAARPATGEARLVQLSEPTPEGVVEFLDLPWLPAPDAALFGLRVDGDSMAPRVCDGDIVVCRYGAEPLPGGTAVVRLRGRIGVTVKLWRPEGEKVHLIPINETYDPTVCDLADVLWAWRVLWVVRM